MNWLKSLKLIGGEEKSAMWARMLRPTLSRLVVSNVV